MLHLVLIGKLKETSFLKMVKIIEMLMVRGNETNKECRSNIASEDKVPCMLSPWNDDRLLLCKLSEEFCPAPYLSKSQGRQHSQAELTAFSKY